jgi:hypothetical protein
MSIAAIFAVILVTSAVFASGMVNPSKLSLLGWTPVEPNAGETVFVDPRWHVKAITLEPVGSLFTIHVNVSSVTDLYAYQVNVTWNPAILDFSRIVSYGDLLARTGSTYGTSRIEPTVANVSSSASIAETILGNYAGITGSGRLFSVEFRVVGYGKCDWAISVAGSMPTMLLTSTGSSMSFTTVQGTFDNRLKGDITGPGGPGVYDGLVNTYDLGYLGGAFGTSNAIADFTGPAGVPDGIVNTYDLGALGGNFGAHYP